MKKAGEILKSILGNEDSKQAEEWGSFFGGWSKIAGQDLAAHSKVIDVRRGTVLVEVDHPGWMQVLQLSHARVLKAMKKKYPELELQDIRCYLQSQKTVGTSPPVGIQGPPPTSPILDPEKIPLPVENASQEYREFKSLLARLRGHGKKPSAG